MPNYGLGSSTLIHRCSRYKQYIWSLGLFLSGSFPLQKIETTTYKWDFNIYVSNTNFTEILCSQNENFCARKTGFVGDIVSPVSIAAVACRKERKKSCICWCFSINFVIFISIYLFFPTIFSIFSGFLRNEIENYTSILIGGKLKMKKNPPYWNYLKRINTKIEAKFPSIF